MDLGKYRAHIIRFAALWIFIVVWQTCVVFYAAGSFVSNVNPSGFLLYILCHLSSVGYLLCHVPGFGGGINTMPPWDWRWMAGFIIMLLLSSLAVFSRKRSLRILSGVLFVVAHLIGSLCSFLHICCDIT